MATLIRVNKTTWKFKEALYRQLVPSFDMVYTQLWKELVDTKIVVTQQCASSLTDLVYPTKVENTNHIKTTSGASRPLPEDILRHLVTSQDGCYVALTMGFCTLNIYKLGMSALLLQVKEGDPMTNLKFVEMDGATLLYVFFHSRIDVYNISVNDAVKTKTLNCASPINAYKVQNKVVILDFNDENDYSSDFSVFKQDNPFSTEITHLRHFPRIKYHQVFEIHDKHILAKTVREGVYIINLNAIHQEKKFEDVAENQNLCVQTFLADDQGAWGKQVCILNYYHADFFFQRGAEMIWFHSVYNLPRLHNWPLPQMGQTVKNIHTTTKEGRTTLHVILHNNAYYTQEICH